VARKVPLDRLLLETDCPYLAPEPYRGMRNEPGMVRIVAEKIAALRDMPVAELIAATGANAVRLFALRKGKTLLATNL
jgi:TatD DNase family protein